MSDGLSQAEIDALMNGGSAAAEDDSKEEKVEEKTEQSEAEIKKKPWKMQRLTLTMRSSPAWTNRLEWT